MAFLQSKFEDEELEVVEASQSVGTKRKRDEATGPGPNVIGNQHEVEESKEEAEDVRQRRRSPRLSKSPGMQLRRGRKSNTAITGSAEIVNKAAKLTLKETQMRVIGDFAAGASPNSDTSEAMELNQYK